MQSPADMHFPSSEGGFCNAEGGSRFPAGLSNWKALFSATDGSALAVSTYPGSASTLYDPSAQHVYISTDYTFFYNINLDLMSLG